jgi:hypothetical protein
MRVLRFENLTVRPLKINVVAGLTMRKRIETSILQLRRYIRELNISF